jgi:hypothetical protein
MTLRPLEGPRYVIDGDEEEWLVDILTGCLS